MLLKGVYKKMNLFRFVERFRRVGYYRLPEAIDAQLISKAREVVSMAFKNRSAPMRLNASGQIARIDSLLERDSVFIDILRARSITPYLIALLGPNPVVARHRHNHATLNRAADIPVRLHRDIQQWTRSLVTVLVYLDPATIKNGATLVVPGSQFAPYAGPQSGGGGGCWLDEHGEYSELTGQELPVEMPSGGVLLVDSLCFHSVGQNRTPGTRMSLTFACHAGDSLSSTSNIEDVAPLFEEAPFNGNSVLPISGSLRNPAIVINEV